jgi:hypothetical protein
MKLRLILPIILLIILGCKQNVTQDNEIIKEDGLVNELSQDSISYNNDFSEKSSNKILQLDVLKSATKPEKIVLEKHIFEDNEKTVLDFHYPILNEEISGNYSNFNRYIKNELVEKTISLMRENEEFIPLCDSIETRKQKSKINYSIKENSKVLSTVFVIENFYSESMHSNVSFKTVNYDFDRTKIIHFKDYFKPHSEQAVLIHLNKIITSNINSGEMYYDCWEISEGDFETDRNNFSVDGSQIRFYFDDCVVCPSYTGTYYIETTKEQLREYIKDYYLLERKINQKL